MITINFIKYENYFIVDIDEIHSDIFASGQIINIYIYFIYKKLYI